jgi:hypothetical protein
MTNQLNPMRSSGLTATMLLCLLAGCQSSGRDQAGRTSKPTPSFGLDYVPRQSEPPVEATRSSAGSDIRKVSATDLDTDAGAVPAKSSRKLTRWLPGSDKELPPRKPLPLSESTAANIDDGSDL